MVRLKLYLSSWPCQRQICPIGAEGMQPGEKMLIYNLLEGKVVRKDYVFNT